MLFDENLLTMSAAAKRIPSINGRRPHRNSVYRWATTGVDGVVLESVVIGRRLCTTEEALDRFAKALAEKRRERRPMQKPVPAPRGSRTPAQRRAAKAAAKKTLAELGV